MFSYNEYKNIINLIRKHIPIKDFSEITEKTKKFCVLRHDIEFSIDRAYELAKIENELGVSSTYTVQVRNNTYNALSEKNIELVKKIKDLGHHIGLHQNPPLMDLEDLGKYIMTDINILTVARNEFFRVEFVNLDNGLQNLHLASTNLHLTTCKQLFVWKTFFFLLHYTRHSSERMSV